MTLHQTWLLSLLRRYAVFFVLLLYLAGKLLAAAVAGDAPQPQIPHDGYVSHRPTVRLSWHRSHTPDGYRVQVIKDGGDFDQPLVEQKSRSSIYTLQKLEGGQTYRWRVIRESDGRTSRVAKFHTADHLIQF